MVSFICDACGQTVKKQKVEKHYQSECRHCSVLSCIDCGKDFPGDSYATHTSCISEAEKYQGKLFKAKEKSNKGEKKQQDWIEQVRSAPVQSGNTDPRVRKWMAKIMAYDNVPRKEKKFKNFCANSVNVRDSTLLQNLWEIFSGMKSTPNNEEQEGKGEEVKPDVNEENTDCNNEVDETTIDCDNNEINEETVDCDNVEKPAEKVGQNGKKNKRKKETCEEKGKKEKKIRKLEKQDILRNEKKACTNEMTKKGKKDLQNEDNNTSRSNLYAEEDGVEQMTIDSTTGKFQWSSLISKVLKSAPDHEMSVKKLRKKVLNEYVAQGGESKPRTELELRVLFEKKLHKHPKIKVHKEKAKLL